MQSNKLAERTGSFGAYTVVLGFVVLAANAVNPMNYLIDMASLLFVVGFIVLAVGGILIYARAKKVGMPLAVIGAVFLMVGIGGALAGFVGLGGVGGPATPPTTPVYVAKWDCNFYTLAAGGPGGAHDAVTEFPDSPFTAADGGTPDLNKVIATPLYDLQQKKATVDLSVDDDVAETATGWIDEDTYSFDVHCFLTNPTPAVGGGNQEIPFWGKISATRTTGTMNNGSFAHVFYGDITAGTYLGWGKLADSGAAPDGHDADHSYVSYTSQITYPAAAPLEGDWIQLGTSDGDPDGEWVSAWFVLDVGFSDYTTPAIGSDVILSLQVGTMPGAVGYSGNTQSLQIELNLLARA